MGPSRSARRCRPDIRPRANDDAADVGAQHAIIPDADAGSDRHVADDPRNPAHEGADQIGGDLPLTLMMLTSV